MSKSSFEELQAQIKALQAALRSSESLRKSEEKRHQKIQQTMTVYDRVKLPERG